MTRRRIYSIGFAVINFAEATVCLACLGQWSPRWVMSFAKWYALRDIKRAARAQGGAA
jgi:hypothetical protein